MIKKLLKFKKLLKSLYTMVYIGCNVMSLLESFVALYFCVSMLQFVHVDLDIASGFILGSYSALYFWRLNPQSRKKKQQNALTAITLNCTIYETLLKLIKSHSYIINDYKTETTKANIECAKKLKT